MDATIAAVVGSAATATFTGDGDTFRVDELKQRIAYLESENKKLSETVDWMHQLIWDMYKKMRAPGQSQASKN